jgi:hypothetical protein
VSGIQTHAFHLTNLGLITDQTIWPWSRIYRRQLDLVSRGHAIWIETDVAGYLTDSIEKFANPVYSITKLILLNAQCDYCTMVC